MVIYKAGKKFHAGHVHLTRADLVNTVSLIPICAVIRMQQLCQCSFVTFSSLRLLSLPQSTAAFQLLPSYNVDNQGASVRTSCSVLLPDSAPARNGK